MIFFNNFIIKKMQYVQNLILIFMNLQNDFLINIDIKNLIQFTWAYKIMIFLL